MSAKDICRAGRRFLGWVQQTHVSLLHLPSPLAMIAVRAGCHDVRPNVLAAKMTRHDMVHRQTAVRLSAVLAGIIVPAKHLAAGQLDMGARPMDLGLQSDHRWTRQ